MGISVGDSSSSCQATRSCAFRVCHAATPATASASAPDPVHRSTTSGDVTSAMPSPISGATTDEADEKLQPVIRDLERTLPRVGPYGLDEVELRTGMDEFGEQRRFGAQAKEVQQERIHLNIQRLTCFFFTGSVRQLKQNICGKQGHAVQEDDIGRVIGQFLLDGLANIQVGFQCPPCRGTFGAVVFDARLHFLIPGGGGCHVQHAAAMVMSQLLGITAFAAAGTAHQEREPHQDTGSLALTPGRSGTTAMPVSSSATMRTSAP